MKTKGSSVDEIVTVHEFTMHSDYPSSSTLKHVTFVEYHLPLVSRLFRAFQDNRVRATHLDLVDDREHVNCVQFAGFTGLGTSQFADLSNVWAVLVVQTILKRDPRRQVRIAVLYSSVAVDPKNNVPTYDIYWK